MADTDETPRETVLVAQAGVPMSIGSRLVEGDVAFEIAFGASGGSCTTEMRASRRSADEGPTTLRVWDNESWTYNVGSSPSAGAGGSRLPVAPEEEGDFGFLPSTRETPAMVQYWANDVADVGSPRTYGAAFWVGWVCDQDTEVRLRASRQAFLASDADFAPTAGAGVPFVGSAVVDGWFSVDGTLPLEFFHLLPVVGEMELTASQFGKPVPLGPEGWVRSLPAGPIRFGLTGTGAANDALFAGARFQEIRTAADLESLPE